MVIHELASIAIEVADAARPVPLRYFRKPLAVDTKGDLSPVTVADRETELAMRAVLDARCADHGIYGEEHGQRGLDRRFIWVIDPIDGTRSFITGMPLFTTLIALLDDRQPVIGIIDVPALAERYHAVRGGGVFFNDAPIHTSGCAKLDDAIVYIAGHDPDDDRMRERMHRLFRHGRLHRYGYDGFAYAQLASGHIDIMIEAGLQPYDYMALVTVVEEAGGVITDWSGKPLTLESGGDVLATASRELHAQVLDVLAR
ncbi:MAG: histidinol-phosphatase [Geminicoccaceae bacterium]|nr:histidinol-phosphatase [Geminicoccaceae bacterium]MCB9942778.1 histidinol-phosphatase [Geminicoccaceae bacterium]